MAKDTLYNQVNPLVRVKETELLGADVWQNLIAASSLEKVRQILSATPYARYVKEEFFADNFEASLTHARSKFFTWAYQVAPEPELVDIYTLRYTFHNLKVLTKADLTGQTLDHLFLPDGRFTADMIKSAVRTQASSILPDYLMDGIAEVMHYFEEGNILQGIDIIYDRLYLTQQRRLADSLGYPELVEEVTGFIDFTNMIITMRGLLQKQTPTFLTTVLSSSGSIPKKDFLACAGLSLKEYTAFLLTTKYKNLLEKIVVGDEIQVKQMVVERDNYLTHFFARAKVQAFGPLPLLSLMNAHEVEEKNLRLIVTAKNNGFSKEAVLERMRVSDAI